MSEVKRVGGGRWAKGHSGNPKGGVRKSNQLAAAIDAAVSWEDLVARVLEILDTSPSETMRLAAASWLADRRYARPQAAQEIKVSHTHELEGLSLEELEDAIASARRDLEAYKREAIDAEVVGEVPALPAPRPLRSPTAKPKRITFEDLERAADWRAKNGVDKDDD